ncbi:unnamed protein product [Ilex paraguariensis]|uniref:Uncharacterized protein n=1 Tax=Ilex paraguariensis TaxID=185542 RepID=A0ABC8TX33_9AQUA
MKMVLFLEGGISTHCPSLKNSRPEQEKVDDDFGSLPDWLKDAAYTSDLVLPWLPISPDRLNLRMPFSSSGGNEDLLIEVEEDEQEFR